MLSACTGRIEGRDNPVPEYAAVEVESVGQTAPPSGYDPVLERTFAPGNPARTGAFPKQFRFGAATSAHQVEGGNTNNDWYAYERICNTELIQTIRTIHPLCQHWSYAGKADRHAEIDELKKDLIRAKEMGLDTYRFSIEWSRVEPAEGHFDPEAIAYYRVALLLMRELGLEPMITLHHYTLPLWLSDPIKRPNAANGFMDRAIVAKFGQYVRRMALELGDLVQGWITENEPVAEYAVGYLLGAFPPGEQPNAEEALRNLLRAHGEAYGAIHDAYRLKGWPAPQVGIAHAMMLVKVAPRGPFGFDNNDAAKQFHYIQNDLFIKALLTGCFRLFPTGQCEQDPTLKALPGKLDFLGINYYRSVYVYRDLLVSLFAGHMGGGFENDLSGSPDVPHTGVPHGLINGLGWEVMPDGLYRILVHANALLQSQGGKQIPIVITENGFPQRKQRDTAQDDLRAPYLISHLQSVLRAREEGVNVIGYLHWSLVDNWELAEGYWPASSFGLYSIDRTTPDLHRSSTRGREAYEELISRRAVDADLLKRYGTVAPDGMSVVRPEGLPGPRP